MKSFQKLLWLSSVAAVSLPITALQAQQTPAQTEQAAADTEELAPNEIIVTARKTKETLQDTPIAVSVVTGEFLEKTGFVSTRHCHGKF